MADTRKRILDAAREAFNRDGLGRVGVRDVARATDMSPGNLAYHFPTKDELVTALVGELHDLNRSTAFVEPMESFSLESLYRAATAAMRNMLGYRFVLLDYVEGSSDGFRILVRDSPPGSGTGTYVSIISDTVTRVEGILGDQFAARGFDPKVAPLYAQMLVGMVSTTGQWWLDARTPDKDVVAAHLVNLAWNGLANLEQDPELRGR